MKIRLSGIVVLAGLIGCATAMKDRSVKRGPASEVTEQDREMVITAYREIIELHERTKNRFKILRFPTQSEADVELGFVPALLGGRPDQFDKAYEAAFRIQGFGMTWGQKMDGRDRLRTLLTSRLSLAERDQLLEICMDNGVAVGDFLNPATFLANSLVCKEAGLLHTEEELRQALQEFPAEPKGVRYDGQRGFHIYQNLRLKKQVRIITAAVNTHLHRFYELFMDMPSTTKDKFRTNREGAAEKDKVEPFDLISTYAVQHYISKNSGLDEETKVPINKIQISKMTQKALARMLHMKDEMTSPWKQLPNLTLSKGDNTLSVMCANGLPHSDGKEDVGGYEWRVSESGTELLQTWRPELDLGIQVERKLTKAKMTCNGTEYNFNLESLPADKIPDPSPIQLNAGQDLHALMTVSLVNEIDRSAIDQARAMVGMMVGWQAVGEITKVNTRKFLRQQLAKADAYFPVMHAMDVNYFNIGTENGLALHLQKTVNDAQGVSRLINLVVLLPDAASGLNSVIMKPEDLAQIMHERFQSKPSPLFLMNNSCSSDKTLFAWTLVFREALKLRKSSASTATDFPHIIGSKRYFDTSSLLEIFSHAEYPLKSLEMLGEGKSIDEILEFLKQPVQASFLNGLSKLFQGTKNEKKNAPAQSFEPVYVMDHPELLSLGGFRITVTGPAIQGQDRY